MNKSQRYFIGLPNLASKSMGRLKSAGSSPTPINGRCFVCAASWRHAASGQSRFCVSISAMQSGDRIASEEPPLSLLSRFDFYVYDDVTAVLSHSVLSCCASLLSTDLNSLPQDAQQNQDELDRRTSFLPVFLDCNNDVISQRCCERSVNIRFIPLNELCT